MEEQLAAGAMKGETREEGTAMVVIPHAVHRGGSPESCPDIRWRVSALGEIQERHMGVF